MNWLERRLFILFNPRKIKVLKDFAMERIPEYDWLAITPKGWELVFNMSFYEILERGYLDKE